MSIPERILVLVPHDPEEDPRVGWVNQLCASVAETHVIASTWSTEKPARMYEGRQLFVERVNISETASLGAKSIASLTSPLAALALTRRVQEGDGRIAESPRARAEHLAGSVMRAISSTAWLNLIVSSLRRRGLTESLPPRVVVCHDVYALVPAIAMKRRFGCAVIYDSHEYWPEADLLAPRWEQAATRAFERRFIRHADQVVTVTPQLADLLQRVYGVRDVIAVPNAEPRVEIKPRRRPDEPRLVFLLQGRVSHGRGIDELLEAWTYVDPGAAVLELRCPHNAYLDHLLARHASLFDAGRVRLVPPVSGPELVQAASTADVGVIPYAGTSLNHQFACPNKLSQYMAAGLAVVSNDLPFVSDVLAEYQAGVTYDASTTGALATVAHQLAHDRELLVHLRANARQASQTTFNWETVSAPYREAIVRLATTR